MTVAVQTPASRRNDPVTSGMAEDEINASGARGRQQRQVEAAVFGHPGKTSAELAQLCALDRYQISRRAPEAEVNGRIKRGERRRCAVLGRAAMTWWPA